MKKVKIYHIPFKLKGEVIKKDEKLVFKAEDQNGIWDIEHVKGKKIISLFPSINTKVCDIQTQTIAKMAQQYKDITFISISTDSIETQNKWCISKGFENILIVSDDKYKEFQTKTNAYIPKVNKLIRGFILLNEENVVKEIALNNDLAKAPNYTLLNKWIK
ncbi:MAG: redoxin family protein [Mycoplasmatales bacterium]|nr:redoxin family protein [Mycoplasmatales bacterium]